MRSAAERLTGSRLIPPWVRHEHMARYRFCASYVAGKRVIDCACGAGIGSALFADSGAAAVDAFDGSEEAVAAARAQHARPQVRFQAADAARLPLPDRSADLYIALETIEHLHDDAPFLCDVRRVLKPDGLFICSTPNRAVTNPGASLGQRPWNPFHAREYAAEEFFQHLRGWFGVVDCYGQNRQRAIVQRARSSAVALVPPSVVGWVGRLCKAPLWVFDRYAYHAVEPCVDGAVYEYLLALCRFPRTDA